MADIKVAILKQSQSLTDQQVAQAVPTLQEQASNDFAPVWGIYADLTFVPAVAQPAPTHGGSRSWKIPISLEHSAITT
jgi:hypothetical protein